MRFIDRKLGQRLSAAEFQMDTANPGEIPANPMQTVVGNLVELRDALTQLSFALRDYQFHHNGLPRRKAAAEVFQILEGFGVVPTNESRRSID